MRLKAICILLLCLLLTGCTEDQNSGSTQTSPSGDHVVIKKPVIYVYGYQTDVSVKLNMKDSTQVTCSYPEYNDGWNLIATFDGTMYDKNNTYRYLFWEGTSKHRYTVSDGFCVKGSDTAEFLNEKLAILGLNDIEREDFITYWLPEMQNNPWNIISFDSADYEKQVQLTVKPKPVTMTRIFMTYYPWDKKLSIPEQKLTPVELDRSVPTVIEWGGICVSDYSLYNSNNDKIMH